jgi:hypothetical protein
MKSDQTKTSGKTGVAVGKQEVLPSRFARDNITGGDPYNRMMNNYSKTATSPRLGTMISSFTVTMGR